MRIAIYGAAGTGKTVLAQMISDAAGIPFNPVGSRSVAKAMGFESPYDVDAAGRRAEFQRRLVTEKVAWEAEHEAFVTDRTTLDNIAYTVIHDIHAIDRELLDAAVGGMLRYHYVLFCPMSAFWDTARDASRVHDRVYQELYETVVDALLGKYWVDVRIEREDFDQRLFRVTESTKEARAEFVRKFLEEHK